MLLAVGACHTIVRGVPTIRSRKLQKALTSEASSPCQSRLVFRTDCPFALARCQSAGSLDTAVAAATPAVELSEVVVAAAMAAEVVVAAAMAGVAAMAAAVVVAAAMAGVDLG